jgi:hypothetical protein
MFCLENLMEGGYLWEKRRKRNIEMDLWYVGCDDLSRT